MVGEGGVRYLDLIEVSVGLARTGWRLFCSIPLGVKLVQGVKKEVCQMQVAETEEEYVKTSWMFQ